MEIVREFNQEIATQIMRERGYGLVSESDSDKNGKTLNYAKTVDLGVCLHASVFMKSQMMSLDMVELKFFATLSMKRFDFFHKDFEKYEKIIYLYSRVCRDLDPHLFKLADEMEPIKNQLPTGNKLPPLVKVKSEETKEVKETIEERKRKFWDDIVPIAKQKGLDKAYTLKFYRYWTEHGENDKKFRKEKETSFNIALRIETFLRNDREWSKQKQTTTEKIATKQDEKLKQGNKIIKKDEVF